MGRFIAALLAGVMDGATYGLIALGIVLVYKSTRVLNFAQAEIGTLGIYIEWELWRIGVPVPIAVVVALVAGALMGAATEYVLRPLASSPRLTVTVATLGIATLLGAYQVIQFNPDPHVPPELVPGDLATIAGIPISNGRVFALIVTALLGFVLYTFFKKSLFGLGVLASAQDQTALRLMGIPLNRVSVFTWATGGVLTVLAALILAPTIGVFFPFFMTTIIVQPLAAALVGGLTSLPGAFVGGMIIGVAENFAKFYWGQTVPGAEYIAVFSAILLVLLLRPRGLLGAEA